MTALGCSQHLRTSRPWTTGQFRLGGSDRYDFAASQRLDILLVVINLQAAGRLGAFGN